MKFDALASPNNSGYTTRRSHLQRLGKLEESAWEEFYTKYRSMIAAIGARNGLSAQDCDDLMQQVTAVMCDRLRSFVYEPEKCRFRSFLYRVAENLSRNIRRQATKLCPADSAIDLPEYTEPDLDRDFMEKYENFLLAQSLEHLKRSLDSEVYLAFEMLVIENRPVPEVAALTGKTAGALYNIRHRGLKKLREIITSFQLLFTKKEA